MDEFQAREITNKLFERDKRIKSDEFLGRLKNILRDQIYFDDKVEIEIISTIDKFFFPLSQRINQESNDQPLTVQNLYQIIYQYEQQYALHITYYFFMHLIENTPIQNLKFLHFKHFLTEFIISEEQQEEDEPNQDLN